MDTHVSHPRTNMLIEHFAAVERALMAKSNIAHNAGHSLHIGTPREVFVSEFLRSHLGNRWGIGSGEIIDRESMPREKRNQIDIVVFRQDYPRLDFGGSISAFLCESVIAAVEVKSTLKRAHVKDFIEKARGLKNLDRRFFHDCDSGLIKEPAILCYLVAYDGPSDMQTLGEWTVSLHEELGIAFPQMEPSAAGRLFTNSPALDGVFVIGKGFVHFDNAGITPHTGGDAFRQLKPDARWVISRSDDSNLFFLFLILTQAITRYDRFIVNVLPYMPYGGVRHSQMALV